MTEWKTNYSQRVRMTKKNYDRLLLSRGELTVAGKLDEILNLYYENRGGEKEQKELDRRITRYKKLL